LTSASSKYVLGHTDYELERLARQARLVDPITRRFFVAAGIVEGMRVLDVGSGAGHTAMLLADIVGSSGEIVGADLSELAIEAAKQRVAAAGVTNITFRQGDPATMALGQFDAVAGRYVLMFIPDPVVALEKLCTLVRSGGPIVFHEPDWDGVRCNPPSPEYLQVCEWVRQALLRSGADDRMGTRLAAVFAAAGLHVPTLRYEALAAAGQAAPDAVRLVTELATTLRSDIERLGFISAGDPDFAELAERIEAGLGPAGTVVGRAEIGAWTTV
jgi:ubiquinone/menaquinone biosynthesis C-methylase UbiE